jgi:hypothetical protein
MLSFFELEGKTERRQDGSSSRVSVSPPQNSSPLPFTNLRRWATKAECVNLLIQHYRLILSITHSIRQAKKWLTW